jgi:methyl-accepting chemotaxis protein
MSERNPQLQRKTNLFNAWFVKLDKEKRNLLKSGRFRLLFLSFAIIVLLLLNLLGVADPQSPLAAQLQDYAVWMHGLEIALMVLLFWQIWRELLQPLLRLCDWADLMRGVNLDARVELPRDSDFGELARDINMLGTMIKNLSRDTEIQLQKHTDHITRESRALAILYDVASSINVSHDLNELFERSLQSLCNNLNANAGIIRQFSGSLYRRDQPHVSRQCRSLPVDPVPLRQYQTRSSLPHRSAELLYRLRFRWFAGQARTGGAVDLATVSRERTGRDPPVLSRR